MSAAGTLMADKAYMGQACPATAAAAKGQLCC